MATASIRHWQSATHSRTLQAAVVFSGVVHLGLFVATITNWRPPAPKAIPISFEVNFAAAPTPEPDPESKVVAPPPPAPKPEPPKPEPKKEEPKKEEPKPEPKKEPEKVAEKKPEPKPEPKKEPEKKPEPKKEPEKKETPKKEPEKKPTPSVPAGAPSTLPKPEVVAAAPPPSSGVQQNQLPSILNAWGRNVQRKVEKSWYPPAGMQLTPEQREVHIKFTVGRNGMLLAEPTVVKAANQALAQSGINAIVAAQPLPPLPIEYAAEKQEVIYVFIVGEQPAVPGGTG